ncbi:MAG: type II toxin-antitoxin system RelE/ParE family toxin [Dokdonella sp.]
MAEYRLPPAAHDDLDDVFEYTVRQWDLEKAVGFVQMIERTCATLDAMPA